MIDLDYQHKRPRPKRTASFEERQALWDWLTPVLMLGISAAVITFSPLFTHGFDLRLVGFTGIFVLIFSVVRTMVAVAVAVVIALVLRTGMDALGRETLRLAAIVLTAGAAQVIFQPCLGCFALFVYGGVIMVLMMTMLDLEQGEALGFTFFFILFEAVVVLLLLGFIESLF